MKFKIDHDLHIHTGLSTCSKDPEMTPQRILAHGEQYGFKTLCVTDHFWDESVPGASKWYEAQNYPHICRALPLPESDSVRFLFGCEAELDSNFRLGLAPEHFERFDFIIIPTTHMHMRMVVKEEDFESFERRAELWVERLDAVLDMDLPFHKVGIAHLACKFIGYPTWENYESIFPMVSDSEMERLFTKAAKLGVGIEINSTDVQNAQKNKELVLRPFQIAKQCGCKFYLGSDAHQPFGLEDAIPLFEQAIDWLDLRESDKFVLEF